MRPNTASVRKYYRTHSDEIIARKTLHACKQEGRIPRLSTMQKHQMQWNDVLQAFAEWQASRPVNDGERMKRESRLRALMQAAYDRQKGQRKHHSSTQKRSSTFVLDQVFL